MKIWIALSSIIFFIIASAQFFIPKNWSEPAKASRYARVVALAPSYSETMLSMHEEHRLVGVTIHCEGDKLKNIAKIGSFAEPSFEAIIAQNPDLVLAVPHVMAQPVLEKLKENHIEVFAHQPDSLRDIKFIVMALAIKFGVPQKAYEINREIDTAIKNAQNLVATRNLKGSKALIAVSHMPFVVASINTFPGEIIEALGLTNMASHKGVPWPVWPLENLSVDPPQFLIVANGRGALPHYQKIIKNLFGDDAPIRLVVPEHAIFYSPSPVVAKDTYHLAHLLFSSS